MKNYDIILAYPKTWEREFNPPNQPPFGLLMVSHLLKEAGYEIFVYDQRLEAAGEISRSVLERAVKNSDPIFFGFSCQSGPPIKYALELSAMFRHECPDTPIVWGGVHASLLPEQTVSHEMVDVVVKGEGEVTAYEMARALEKGRSLKGIKGLYFRHNGSIIKNQPREPIKDIDKIDIRWDLVDPKKYIRNIDGRKRLGTITSRGCPYRCAFCYNLAFYGKGYWRGWSPERLMEEIRRLVSWGVDSIRFEDDNIMIDQKRVAYFCKKVREEGLDIEWFAPARGHYLTDDFTKTIKDGGCASITIGAESGSDRVLDLMRKGTRVEHYLQAARVLKKHRIHVNYNWILGFPGETREDLQQTIQAIKDIERINDDSIHILNIFAPYPGTDGYEAAVKKGFVPPENLEGWAENFREQCNQLRYIDNKRYIETVRWTAVLRAMAKRKRMYASWSKLPIGVLGITSNLRWKTGFYGLPVEFSLMNAGRRLLDTAR